MWPWAWDPDLCPAPDGLPEVALIGRSNVVRPASYCSKRPQTYLPLPSTACYFKHLCWRLLGAPPRHSCAASCQNLLQTSFAIAIPRFLRYMSPRDVSNPLSAGPRWALSELLFCLFDTLVLGVRIG